MLRFMPNLSDYASKFSGAFASVPAVHSSGGPRQIALVTTLPQVFSILTCGLDAYAANRVAVTPYSIDKFLDANQIEGLKVTLFFVPALTGQWSQSNPGSLSELEGALNSGGPYDRVINVCHAIPLYRRSRLGLDNLSFEDELTNAGLFGDTLVALAAISRQLQGHFLEPRDMGFASYSSRESRRGLSTISDDVRETDWVNTHDPMWAPPTNIGIQTLDGLQSTLPGWDQFGRPAGFRELLDELSMTTLLDRFIYSEFERDFDLDAERLWATKGHESSFANTDKIFKQAMRKHHSAEVQKALETDARFNQAKQDLQTIIAQADDEVGAETLKMIDISTLLGLVKGALPNDAPKTKAAKRFMSEHPVTVSFQQAWDRNAYRSTNDELNRVTNAWYISNGLLVAKRRLENKIPEMNLWAAPIMPTNSVRFVLNPKIQRQSVSDAMTNGLTRLAELQLAT